MAAGLAIGLKGGKEKISANSVVMTGTRPLGEDRILVYSRISPSGTKDAKVEWRLRKNGDRYLVLDILMLGARQFNVIKRQFEAITSTIVSTPVWSGSIGSSFNR